MGLRCSWPYRGLRSRRERQKGNLGKDTGIAEGPDQKELEDISQVPLFKAWTLTPRGPVTGHIAWP